MECLVCNRGDAEVVSGVDHVDIDCTDCGQYVVSGTVTRILDRGQWLNTVAMQQLIEEERRDGVKRPVINSTNVVYSGIVNPQLPTSL